MFHSEQRMFHSGWKTVLLINSFTILTIPTNKHIIRSIQADHTIADDAQTKSNGCEKCLNDISFV